MIPLLLDIPKDASTWVALAIALGAVSFIMFRSKKRKKDPLARAPNFSLAQQRSVERQMQNLLVELSEMARQISSQLDTRAAKLELLIRDADERLAELRRMESAPRERQPLPPPAFEPVSAPPPPAPPPRPVEVDPRYVAIYELSDQGRSAQDIATKLDRPKGEIELILALRPR